MVNAVATAAIPGTLLAHQGGWDEMLLIAGPIAIVAALLWVARRRVTKAAAADAADTPKDADSPV